MGPVLGDDLVGPVLGDDLVGPVLGDDLVGPVYPMVMATDDPCWIYLLRSL